MVPRTTVPLAKVLLTALNVRAMRKVRREQPESTLVHCTDMLLSSSPASCQAEGLYRAGTWSRYSRYVGIAHASHCSLSKL